MTLKQSALTLEYGVGHYAEQKGVNVSYLNILICNRDMLLSAVAAAAAGS